MTFQETPDLKTGSISDPPDLIIKFKEKKFPVHRSVLIEKCKYFRIMLTKFKEADASEIDIEFDADEEIFQAIINYIYTDEIVFSTNNVEDIPQLQSISCWTICSNLHSILRSIILN